MTVEVLHAPKNTIRRIDSVWMVISVDPEDNTEGVCAAPMGPGGMLVPLIAADERRLEDIKAWAKRLRDMGQTVKMIRLTSREEVNLLDS